MKIRKSRLKRQNSKRLKRLNWQKSKREKTITVYSSGKMLNATGWKIGWTVGPSDLTKQATFVHECSSFTLNVPGQQAIAASLD